jgi:hypothetical protein
LGTLAAMPVWTIASPVEMAGFILLVPGFFIALRMAVPVPENGHGLPESLVFLAAAAVFVTLFLPWNFAPHVRWPVMAAAGADYVLFWLKIALCCGVVLRIPSPPFILMSLCTVSGAVGAALVLFSGPV